MNLSMQPTLTNFDSSLLNISSSSNCASMIFCSHFQHLQDLKWEYKLLVFIVYGVSKSTPKIEQSMKTFATNIFIFLHVNCFKNEMKYEYIYLSIKIT